MNSINYSFASLHSFSLPTKGAYKDFIGTVVFGDYETKVMTKTGSLEINGNTYNCVEGFVLVKPLADQYQALQKQKLIRRIDNWSVCNKKYIANLQSQDPRSENPKPVSISIEGSGEIKGTYFRPEIVLDVLEWLCPDFKKEIKAVYEDHVVQHNANRQAVKFADQYHGGIREEDILKLEGFEVAEEPSESEEAKVPADGEQLVDDEDEALQIQEDTQKDLQTATDRLKVIRARRRAINNPLKPIPKTKKIKAELAAIDVEESKLELEQETLQAKLNTVIADLIRIAKDRSKKSFVYEIYEVGRKEPIYTGITEQAPKGSQTSAEVRFGQHCLQAFNHFKGQDLMHGYMSGCMAKHCALKGVSKSKVAPEDFKELFTVKEVREVRVTRKGILDEETKHIQEIREQYPQALLLNTQKNPTLTSRAKSTAPPAPSKTSTSDSDKERCPNCKRLFASLAAHKKCPKAAK